MSVGIRQKWGSADGKVAVMESAPSLLDRKHATGGPRRAVAASDESCSAQHE
jgi:hypothetical protein